MPHTPQVEDLYATSRLAIERVRNISDEPAWNEFCQFYWDIVIGWAIKMGCDANMAQDVFQETMICLMRALPSFKYDPSVGHFRSFLKSIVIRRVADAFRREGRQSMFEPLAVDDPDELSATVTPDGDGARAVDIVWLRSVFALALRRARNRVRPTTYMSFCLLVIDGKSAEEVAAAVGLKRPDTVYMHRRRFADSLLEEFAESLRLVGESIPGRFSDGMRRAFDIALEEFVRFHRHLWETLKLDPAVCDEVMTRVLAVRRLFARTPPPDQPGTYLYHVVAERSVGTAILQDTTTQVIEKVDGATYAAAAARVAEAGTVFQSYRLNGDIIIGRGEACALILPDVCVSSRHAAFAREGSSWFIKDAGSANGVIVNGRAITQDVRLVNGDVIQITPFHLFVFVTA